MEDIQPTQISLEIERVRRRYEEVVIPKQREALSNIKVAPIQEIISSDFETKITESFKEQPQYSSEQAERKAKDLEDHLDPMGSSNDVREVDGYIVRRRNLGNSLVSTEIFDFSQGLPVALVELAKENNLGLDSLYQYKYLIISDNSTGLSTDLLCCTGDSSGSRRASTSIRG